MARTQQQIDRILGEVQLLAARFRHVEYDDDNLAYVIIKDFDLPEGFNKKRATLLIDLGPDYGRFPPQDWYLSRRLRRNGQTPGHYFETSYPQKTYCQQGYAWYCCHIQRWQPNAYSMIQGDNLLTAVEAVYRALHSD